MRFGLERALHGLGIYFDPFRKTALLSRLQRSLDTQLRPSLLRNLDYIAGLYLVLAITAMQAERKRYYFFLVPRDAPGLEVIAAPTPPSMRPVGHVALRLSACRVPATALLGTQDTAYETMALPFRDAEDAVGTSGMAGNLAGLVRLLAAELPPPDSAGAPTDEVLGELGALAGPLNECGPRVSTVGLARR